jgi:hypothetical protein
MPAAKGVSPSPNPLPPGERESITSPLKGEGKGGGDFAASDPKPFHPITVPLNSKEGLNQNPDHLKVPAWVDLSYNGFGLTY